MSGQRRVTDRRSVRRLRAITEMEESELLHVSEDGTTVCEKYMGSVCRRQRGTGNQHGKLYKNAKVTLQEDFEVGNLLP